MTVKQTNVDTRIKLFNPSISKMPDSFIDIIGIELTDDYTRIDFVVYPDTKTYVSGWWVQINKNSFIRPTGTTQKLKLVKAVNIPYAPKKYMFSSRTSCLPYTLFFPAIPKTTTHIDIIEKEVRNDSYFNFYGVSVLKTKSPIHIPIN